MNAPTSAAAMYVTGLALLVYIYHIVTRRHP